MIARNCFLIRQSIVILLVSLCPLVLLAQPEEKIVITEADQLPRIAYPFEGKAVDLVNDMSLLAPFVDSLETEIQAQLQQYDIRDEATMRAYIQTLRTIDFLTEDYEAALEKIGSIREMHDKPADRLTSGLIVEASH